MLYTIAQNLSDYQFLYIDLILLIPLSIFMGDTNAYEKLTPHIPTGALISLPVISSVLSSFAIQLGFQIFSFNFVREFSFYTPPVPDPGNPSGRGANKSFENTSVFWVSSFQYLSTVIAFSVSKPFRKALYTNKVFSIALFLMLAFNIYLVVTRDKWAIDFFEFEEHDMTTHFKLWIGIIVIVNFVITYFMEKVVIWYVSVWWKRRTDRKNLSLREQEIEEDESAIKLLSKNKESALHNTNIGGENVYLPPIDEDAVQESAVEEDKEQE